MSDYSSNLIAVAKAEDLYNLQNHIAWTDVILPKLRQHTAQLSTMLVAEALGTPLPPPLTREKIAGMCYGVNYITTIMEKVLHDGERALKDLSNIGVSLQTQEISHL